MAVSLDRSIGFPLSLFQLASFTGQVTVGAIKQGNQGKGMKT
jgi:hypothetical protein